MWSFVNSIELVMLGLLVIWITIGEH
jgi:hypothetical protein